MTSGDDNMKSPSPQVNGIGYMYVMLGNEWFQTAFLVHCSFKEKSLAMVSTDAHGLSLSILNSRQNTIKHQTESIKNLIFTTGGSLTG